MGTNYYLETDFCHCCGKPKSKIHLGKSSAGWKFLFRKTRYVKSYEDFLEFIKKGVIVNEYEVPVSELEMIDLIQTKQKEKSQGFDIDGYDFLDTDFC